MYNRFLHTILFFVLLFVSSLLYAGKMIPVVPAEKMPFAPNGKIVSNVWKDADLLTAFTVPGKAKRAIYQTKAKMLYDKENLYFHIVTEFDPLTAQKVDSGKKRSVFSVSHVEIFLQPDPEKERFFHIALADKCVPYTAEGFRRAPLNGLKAWYFRAGKNLRVTNFLLPLKSVGLSSPAAGKKIRFNVCYVNFDLQRSSGDTAGSLRGTLFEESSFTVLDQTNFRNPATWSYGQFTGKRKEKSKVIAGNNLKKIKINLFANSDFSYCPDSLKKIPGWNFYSFGKNTVRNELMPMSGIWHVSVSNRVFLRAYCRNIQAGKEYTLRIRARGVNGANQIEAEEYIRIKGKLKKVSTVAPRTALSNAFISYNYTFRPKADNVELIFYRTGSKEIGNKSYADIASVELYEGRFSGMELRTLSNPGLKSVDTKTIPEEIRNRIGKFSAPLRILAFSMMSGSLNNIREREIREIFAGTGAELDILLVHEKDSDVYYTSGNPAEIMEKLRKGKYDLYLFGRDRMMERVGKIMAGQVEKNVVGGATVCFFSVKKPCNFASFLKKYPLKKLSPEDPRLDFSVADMILFPSWVPRLQNGAAEGRAGKGKIVRINTMGYTYHLNDRIYLPSRDYTAIENLSFPCDRYLKMNFRRLLQAFSGKEKSRILSIRTTKEKAFLTVENTPENTPVHWEIAGEDGIPYLSGKGKIQKKQYSFMLPEDVLSGKNILCVKTLDAKNSVLDWCSHVFRKEGPALKVTNLVEYYSGNKKGRFAVEILQGNKTEKDLLIKWQLRDFSGRILEEGKMLPGKNGVLEIPLTHIFTSFAVFQVTLEKNSKEIAKKTLPFFVQDRDAKRVFSNGFTFRMYGTGTGITEEGEAVLARQMEKIGVNMLTPGSRYCGIDDMRNGMATGGGFLGGGTIFWGRPQKSNIRFPNFNTAKARREIYQNALKQASFTRKYGFTFDCVCDEPNLSRQWRSDEVDSHPENIAEFRKRMEKKYGTISHFNSRMKSNWKSFSELQPVLTAQARKEGRFGEFIEWRNFNIDRWVEVIKLMSDAQKKTAPHARFALQNSFGQGIYSGNDYAKLFRKAGLDFAQEYTYCVYFGKNPVGNFDELMRSFNPSMLSWGAVGFHSTPAHISFTPWWNAAHRYGGMGWYATVSGSWNMIDRSTLGLTKDAVLLGKTLEKSRLQQGLGKLFLTYPWKKNPVAIYYSQTSMQTAFLLGKETKNCVVESSGPLHNYFYSRQGAQFALEALLYQYDFISYDQVEEGKLQDYKVLIMPSIISMSDQEIHQVKKFISSGGKVICDFAPGAYDELGNKRKENPWTENIFLTGKIFNENTLEGRLTLEKYLKKCGVSPLLVSPGIAETPGREVMHFTDSGNSVFIVLRNFALSNDKKMQTFQFPEKGHIYNLRTGKYYGYGNKISERIPNADAVVWGVYPAKLQKMHIFLPKKIIPAGTNLVFTIKSEMEAKGKPGKRIFHVALFDPDGSSRFFMKRDLVTENGKAEFCYRMAFNDKKGNWKIAVTDVLTRTTVEKMFQVK